MLNQKLLIGGIVLALVVPLLFGAYDGSSGFVGPKGDKGDQGDRQLGALVGNELNFPSWVVNGVTSRYHRVGLNQASTTLCSMRNLNATSTFTGGIDLRTSDDAAMLVAIARGVKPGATTTIIGNQIAVVALEQATIVATSTSAQILTLDHLIAPLEYVNITAQGDSGTYSLTGACTGEFRIYGR